MPRRSIWSARQRAALFDLPTDEASLLRHYTLSDDDIEHIRIRRGGHNRRIPVAKTPITALAYDSAPYRSRPVKRSRFPAGAGMTRRRSQSLVPPVCLPSRCGDDPVPSDNPLSSGVIGPQLRGQPLHRRHSPPPAAGYEETSARGQETSPLTIMGRAKAQAQPKGLR